MGDTAAVTQEGGATGATIEINNSRWGLSWGTSWGVSWGAATEQARGYIFRKPSLVSKTITVLSRIY